MEVHKLAADNMEAEAAHASDVLSAGGVILYPTDTLYGLGAEAFSDAAVGKVREIKMRDDRPMHVIVADIEMASEYGEINETACTLANAFLPGALTLIVPKKNGITGGIARAIDTIGFRIPDNAFCLAVARAYGRPFTATSANVNGRVPERSCAGVAGQLAQGVRLIDAAFDAGELPQSLPSTVVDISDGSVRIVREGAIPNELIFAVL